MGWRHKIRKLSAYKWDEFNKAVTADKATPARLNSRAPEQAASVVERNPSQMRECFEEGLITKAEHY